MISDEERYQNFEKELSTAVFPIIKKYHQFDVKVHVGATMMHVISSRVVDSAIEAADKEGGSSDDRTRMRG